VLTLVGCSTQRSNLPTDNDIVEQWNREQVKMQALAQECQGAKNIYNLNSKLFTLTHSGFAGCKLNDEILLTQKSALPFKVVARHFKTKEVIFVIGQHELVDGWWIWKEPILEQKGLLYVLSQDSQVPINSGYQIIDQETLDREGLDRYSGDYGLTQTAKSGYFVQSPLSGTCSITKIVSVCVERCNQSRCPEVSNRCFSTVCNPKLSPMHFTVG
jgi:hypothetical protein